NGSNTTAVAAVAKLRQAGEVSGRRAVVTASTGPVGMRAAGLLAKAGAHVVVTSRKPEGGAAAGAAGPAGLRAGGPPRPDGGAGRRRAASGREGGERLLNAGGAGVRLVPRDAWMGRPGLRAVADVNAVPPLGIEGVEVTDNGADRGGVIAFGALGVGGLKMKI